MQAKINNVAFIHRYMKSITLRNCIQYIYKPTYQLFYQFNFSALAQRNQKSEIMAQFQIQVKKPSFRLLFVLQTMHNELKLRRSV